MASVSTGEMAGESGKKFSAERFINPNKDVRTTLTQGYSEQLDDLVHPQMFENLDLWESLIYKNGGLRRIKMIHAFVEPPIGYNVREKIPELPYHGNQKPLDLYSRTKERIRKMSNDQITSAEHYKMLDDDDTTKHVESQDFWDNNTV